MRWLVLSDERPVKLLVFAVVYRSKTTAVFSLRAHPAEMSAPYTSHGLGALALLRGK